MKFRNTLVILAVAVLACIGARTAAAAHNADVVTINPATDGGKYLTVQQSNTMPQWSFNVGGTFDYAFEPLEYADAAGNRRRGIVDDLLMANIQGAIAWTDWWEMGVNMPIALWETFYNPNQSAAAVAKQTFYGKMGDARIEMKFRLLNIERYHVGLSIVPFFYFPTGKEEYFLGNGMWSPGALVAFDADIKNRVFLALNVGYRNYANTRYDVNNPNAVLDDSLMLSGGINVRINDTWAVLGEVISEGVIKAYWKNQLQNPAEFLVGGRFTPQSVVKGMGVTLMAGRGITTGIGSPDFRVLAGVNYRRVHEPPPPPPVAVEAAVEEKIVITQKIHFEFDRAVIRPISYPILDDVAYLLQRNPQIRLIRVEGHTDWIGSDAYNQQLSERRANAVRNYLIQKGIEPDRLVAVGYGESRPIADNNTVQGRARNRRTEFTVVDVAPSY
jgi:OOP family OmpA-OmpF porin